MALPDNLAGYWPIDETDESGNGRHLTPVNTPGTGTGHVNTTCMDLEKGDIEYFEYADDATFEFGDVACSFNAWFRYENTWGALFSHYVSSGDRSYLIYLTSGFTIQMIASASGSTAVETHTTAISAATWYMMTGYHDSAGNVIGVSIDGGTPETAAHSAGLNSSCSGNFRLGGSNLTNFSWDGLIEEAAVWTRVLDSTDRSDLWNAGAGASIPVGGGGATGHPHYFRPLCLDGVQFRASEREIERVRSRVRRRHMTARHFGLRPDARRGCLWAPARDIALPRHHDLDGVPRLILPRRAA